MLNDSLTCSPALQAQLMLIRRASTGSDGTNAVLCEATDLSNAVKAFVRHCCRADGDGEGGGRRGEEGAGGGGGRAAGDADGSDDENFRSNNQFGQHMTKKNVAVCLCPPASV